MLFNKDSELVVANFKSASFFHVGLTTEKQALNHLPLNWGEVIDLARHVLLPVLAADHCVHVEVNTVLLSFVLQVQNIVQANRSSLLFICLSFKRINVDRERIKHYCVF